GALTNTREAIVSVPKTAQLTTTDFQPKYLKNSSSTIQISSSPKILCPLKKYETGPVRCMADVDAALAFLQIRLDSLEKVMDDKMKMLLHAAQDIASTNTHRKNNDSHCHRPSEILIDKLLFPKD
ncbi:unnamed protein product, partial [Rotaria socialis]